MGAILDQAWALDVDLTGASLVKASLFATQMAGAHLDGADLTGARVTADLTGAHLAGGRSKMRIVAPTKRTSRWASCAQLSNPRT